MERSLPNIPFDREPRSAGYPPSGHRHSESSPALPGPSPRYSDPGPSVSGHTPRVDYNRHYSIASTTSSNSSLFGTSYSMSSASSDGRRPSREDDYFSPPASRRTSEATKLPSIHELAKDLTSASIGMAHSSQPTREALPNRNLNSHPHPPSEPLPFPPEYPTATIAAISKGRSNSHPTLTSPSFPPPPFPANPSSHRFGNDGQNPISRALGINHQMMRLMKDYEMIQEHSRHIYHFASQYKDSLTRDMARGSDQFEMPSNETVNDHLVRLEEISMRLRDLSAYNAVVPFQPQTVVKHEDDNRMHDIVATSRGSFSGPYPQSPGSVMQYDPASPTDKYWSQSESGRTKYKKRSKRAAPPGHCHSCNIQQTPEWRRGPDGARTLCNACGLHYAKVTKRKERERGSSPSSNSVSEITNGQSHHHEDRQ